MTEIVWYISYTFSTSPNLCNRTTLLNTDVQNCYTTLEFITIRLFLFSETRVYHYYNHYDRTMTNVNQAPLPRLSKVPLVRASLVKRRYIKYLALQGDN